MTAAKKGFSILFGSMFLEMRVLRCMAGSPPLFQYPLWIDVFGNTYGNCMRKHGMSSFSILFGSMFLEIVRRVCPLLLLDHVSVSSLDRCFWKLVQLEELARNDEVSVSSLDRCFWKCEYVNVQEDIGLLFQYPLWIDVFGNLNTLDKDNNDLGFSILFGSMFLEI